MIGVPDSSSYVGMIRVKFAGLVTISALLPKQENTPEQYCIVNTTGWKGSPQDRLTSLQQQLGCGTQCGSCVPELKRLISISP